MDSAERDVVALFEFAARRLTDRMSHLSDDEWTWEPIAGDPRTTVRWRLEHIVDTLTDPRNRLWLGLGPAHQHDGASASAPAPAPAPASASASASEETAASASTALESAIADFMATVRELGDGASEKIGAVAGSYGDATRRSFVLHVIDELIHHAAEAAMLRDLYAAR